MVENSNIEISKVKSDVSSIKSMMNEIDNDYSNASILLDKYLLHCKEIRVDPGKSMEEMMEKILKRHNLE